MFAVWKEMYLRDRSFIQILLELIGVVKFSIGQRIHRQQSKELRTKLWGTAHVSEERRQKRSSLGRQKIIQEVEQSTPTAESFIFFYPDSQLEEHFAWQPNMCICIYLHTCVNPKFLNAIPTVNSADVSSSILLLFLKKNTCWLGTH